MDVNPILATLLYRDCARTRFYRVEIAQNLFAEASVIIEWGLRGGRPNRRIACYNDLRAASRAADRYRNRALRRGYTRCDEIPAARAST